jgi:biopolymer transport protein ExbB
MGVARDRSLVTAGRTHSMQEFWRFVTHDWYFAIPMLCMSLVAVGLVIWRIMLNLNANTNLNQFLPAFQERLTREGVAGAINFCKEQKGLIPRRLFVAGLETSKQGLAASRRAMANVLELEILPQLNFLLPTMLAIGKIATMVGLLGTVISMIGTFSEIQQLSEQGKTIVSQSGAIGLALVATALGLVTAIPLVFAHVMFKAWIGSFEIKMKYAAQKLMLFLQAAKSGAMPAPATGASKAVTPAAAVTKR